MTKKELKQEAEEWINKWELCNKCDHKVQCIEDNAICPQVVERAYLASAEPREKQITGLSKHILELQKDKGNLIDRVRELEQQIEKMKCCYNCSKWNDGECEESPKSKTFFCADFKCESWECIK